MKINSTKDEKGHKRFNFIDTIQLLSQEIANDIQYTQ